MTWEKFKKGIKAIGWRTWMKIFMPLFLFIIFPVIAMALLDENSAHSLMDKIMTGVKLVGLIGGVAIVSLVLLKGVSDFLDS